MNQMGKFNIKLREFSKNDWLHVHQYASQIKVCQYQPWGPNTEEDSKLFVQQVIKDAHKIPRERFTYAIDFHGRMIGSGELYLHDQINREGEIGYIVHPNYWGKGIATEVSRMLIQFGFRDLNLHRIFATCDVRNTASSRVLEKVGMTKEGRIREHMLLRDGWRDSYLYSILEHGWNE